MFKSLKTFLFFLGRKYLEKIANIDKEINIEEVREIIALAREYFPVYSVNHFGSLAELKASFKENYPFSIDDAKLPSGILGLFVPREDQHKMGMILLNNDRSQNMHLSTIAHENGHLFTHLNRIKNGENPALFEHKIYARANELKNSLDDSEEMLADYIACLGAYPLPSFKQVFCNKDGKIRYLYRKIPWVLFFRSGFYILKYYKELVVNFPKTDNKWFHLCLTAHFIRLRAFIYEKYAI